MPRKPLVCANWKLNHLLAETNAYFELLGDDEVAKQIDVVISPVATLLFAACEKTKDSDIHIAAQNVFHEKNGAFTGEWSVAHLYELGCRFAIVGHSERRQYFNESDESVAKKVKACFEGSVTPIVCVGETRVQRENGEVSAVLKNQVDALVSLVPPAVAAGLVIAYEPIWAIGTGLTASAKAAQEAHRLIRDNLHHHFGTEVAEKVRVLYGGSVKADNAFELGSQPDIDGALVGGASLNAQVFLDICKAVAKAQKH